jgi:hypothetical protein
MIAKSVPNSSPEPRHRYPAAIPLLHRRIQRVGRDTHGREKAVGRFVAAHFPHSFREYRIVFYPMPIAVDHGMFQARTDLLGCLVSVPCHSFVSH